MTAHTILPAAAAVLAAASGAAHAVSSEQEGADGAVSAWITAEPQGKGQLFTGHVRAAEAFAGRYVLVSERSGSGGRTRSQQEGAVKLQPGGSAELSHTALSPIGPSDEYSVVLTVYRGDVEVARSVHQR
jgi:hypothetical protein